MKISYNALDIFKDFEIKTVPINSYYYEYSLYNDENGQVFGIIEIENEIIDEDNCQTIGYFGINWEDKILIYYLIKEVK